MQEIVTISLSHRANHLSTQFYNCQEQNLYNNDPKNSVDPSVFLDPLIDRRTKTVTYYPRALLWEAKNGNGSLGIYQYIQDTQDYHFKDDKKEIMAGESSHEVVSTHKKIERSKYQEALDNNEPSPKLTKENTEYWSDYNKLIYQPNSFNSLKDWYHDPELPNLPDYQNLKRQRFINNEQGLMEWKSQHEDFLDENLRSVLEQCDTLQGFNLVTDIDSAWGGFSASLLQELKDEVPKCSLFSWGFFESDILTSSKPSIDNKYQVKNAIQNTLSMMDHSDLFFPIYSDSKLSNWEVGGQTCRIYDTVNSVLGHRDSDKRKTMDYITNCITDGDSKRNLITSITEIDKYYDYSYISRVISYDKKNRSNKEYYEFSNCVIHRGPQFLKDNKKNNDMKNKESFRNLETTVFEPSDTIPEEFRTSTQYSVKLSSTEKARDVFKHWNDYVQKYFRFDDNREELKEDLGTLVSTYEHGWYSDEDSGDDL
ncbi:similar to Saccharomyces cerevisiae YMR211W DML1 Essential protein involved in mtDNA inheritance [Maudiozyma barnettii]|uniref:Protein DML1 n=1 Tax=Maudiozyma barnettii TaxID=61262 RepID=A0A8H2VCC7_9SACH|nr:Dml1p [Kazachstania barnettii]CAB4252690.1 similar to Saccharomyces cerevisiae YMR211W DML1 Essential protein involved in mtDNA inheritance [Kazachstania barnettii]CAD1780480.1 similar to Saccharomyces cerevisiae YMR211W DML1 Essential protein involved in mtDNA inheritance [Kazachstania barnettii]